jgi:hypothetical protein
MTARILVAVTLVGVLAAGALAEQFNQAILVGAVLAVIVGCASGIYAGVHVRRIRRGQSGQVRGPHRTRI